VTSSSPRRRPTPERGLVGPLCSALLKVALNSIGSSAVIGSMIRRRRAAEIER